MIRLWPFRAARWLVIVAVLLASPTLAVTPQPSSPAVEGRLVVKYRPGVDVTDAARASTTTDTLERLHRRLRVRDVRNLFSSDTGSPARAVTRAARFAARLAAVRARFPVRAARSTTSAPDLSNIYVVELPADTDLEAAAALYAADPHVEWAEPDRLVHATLMPNDPFFSSTGTWNQSYADLWGLHVTNAASAWETTVGFGAVVAVIDTGVDHTHPELAGRIWTNVDEIAGNGMDDDGNGFVDDTAGWDFVQNDATPFDQHGHGTHVAGTIAAVGFNGVGVVGMAFGAKIMPVRGLGADGTGSSSALAQALLYAAENGADVLNNSWGGAGQSHLITDAIATARSFGAVVLASSGNAGSTVDNFFPAATQGVIAVGAINTNGTRASFSNYGHALSVTAPGVDILSLRASQSGPVGGAVVASNYLRLSGTSMACPHAAGIAALLLANQPTLTADEVQWHLELSASQPGAPGYETERWNPFYGYGLVNAADALDPVPVTTRLRSDPLVLHGFTDDVQDAAAVQLGFTSIPPVAWSITTPPWLAADPDAGAGPANIDLALDLTGFSPGSYVGSVAVDAPSAVDGGASLSVTAHAHRDERLGPAIAVGGPFRAASNPVFPPPAVASDGLGAFVVWSEEVTTSELYAARIDGAGALSVFPLAAGSERKEQRAVAFDGRQYLVVWKETPRINGRDYDTIKALRVSPAGEVEDAVPISISQKLDSGSLDTLVQGVGFDGQTFVVLWSEVNTDSDRGKVYLRRIGRDGALRGKKPTLIYPLAATDIAPAMGHIDPHIACRPGVCLIAWKVRDGEVAPSGALFRDKAYGIRVMNGSLVESRAFRIGGGAYYVSRVETDGTDFMVVADDFTAPTANVIEQHALVARVTGNGVALDPDFIRVDTGDGAQAGFPRATGLAFDGTDWLAIFNAAGTRAGNQIFANRITPAGVVTPEEFEGLLFVDHGFGDPTATLYPALASTHTQSVVVWADSTNQSGGSINQMYAQRVRAHPSTLPAMEVGMIGPQSVAEGARLRVRLAATGLNLASTTFAAGDLPPGALFDAATGAFHYVPGGTDAGGVFTVHFEATDGVQTVSEDVQVTVTEAIPSLAGTVRLPDGVSPAVGVVLELKGGARELRTGAPTDAQGRYRFEGLSPGKYRVKLAKASKKLWKTRTLKVTIDTGDVTGLDLVATPK